MELLSKVASSVSVKLHVAGDLETIKKICDEYCTVGLCVTVTPTTYIFTGGREEGVTIGLINYPRFPTTQTILTNHAYSLGYKILQQTDQLSFTVEAPTAMFYYYKLEKEDGQPISKSDQV